ncbi:Thylakoid soluble phosphoprotein TSP9 [Corchorus olitorius]|uniref:Thylakoid soluble phosphoprotein TSP9 n=1 Tax=Corchorus olitorius TaxID=93759 RepID=A0A1R3J6P4_9ROSI|nr:Thylakoid soluble phosphoprotein TSP9 [Corchorus olitorius]
MASLPIAFIPSTTRVYAATAAKDQFYETDPLLKKVEEKNGGGTTSGRKNSVSVPQKKKNGGGFGGLFAKK